MVWFLLLQLVLILLNAIFAGTEIAMISADKNKLSKLALQGNLKAKRTLSILQNSTRFFATIQVAITISGFLGAAFASDNFTILISGWLQKTGLPFSIATFDHISIVLVTLILSYCSIVCGEMVPKRIALKHAEPIAMTMSGTILVITKLFNPLIWLLTHSSDWILRLFFFSVKSLPEDVASSENTIEPLIEKCYKAGTLSHAEYTQVMRVLFPNSDKT
jgi:putative hemolysin